MFKILQSIGMHVQSFTDVTWHHEYSLLIIFCYKKNSPHWNRIISQKQNEYQLTRGLDMHEL